MNSVPDPRRVARRVWAKTRLSLPMAFAKHLKTQSDLVEKLRNELSANFRSVIQDAHRAVRTPVSIAPPPTTRSKRRGPKTPAVVEPPPIPVVVEPPSFPTPSEILARGLRVGMDWDRYDASLEDWITNYILDAFNYQSYAESLSEKHASAWLSNSKLGWEAKLFGNPLDEDVEVPWYLADEDLKTLIQELGGEVKYFKWNAREDRRGGWGNGPLHVYYEITAEWPLPVEEMIRSLFPSEVLIDLVMKALAEVQADQED
jgi:hypothetical protein